MPPKGMPADVLSLHRRPSAIGLKRSDLGPTMPEVGAPQGAVFPWTIYPPPDALDFNASTSVTPGAGPVTVTPAALRFQLQRGYVGVIRDITLVVNDMLATTDIVFVLLFNGSPVQGWDQLRILPRVAASVSRSSHDPTVIRVPDGGIIEWRIVQTDGGIYRIGVDYNGWQVSKRVAERFGQWGQ